MVHRGIRFAWVAAMAWVACLATADFDRFQAWIGIDDGAKGRPGDGIFRVQVDGREVYKSKVLRPGFPVEKLDIPLAGAKKLALFIDDEGNGHGGDWGEWLDARLVDSKTGEFVFLTDLVPVEKAWIGACRDRNIIRQPMRVNGTTYLRGWGCISGSELVFQGWDAAVRSAEAAADRLENAAVQEMQAPQVALTKPFPQGLTAQSSAGGVTLQLDPSNPAHAAWLRASASVRFGKHSFALIDLAQPTQRVLHRSINPNRQVLLGGARPQNAVLGGAPWPPQGSLKVEIADLALAASRLTRSGDLAKGKLVVRAKPFRTQEVPDPVALTSALCQVLVDGKEIGDVLSDNGATYQQELPLAKWPERLECVTTPGADGSLADSFVLDLGVQLPGMNEPLWLHTVDPSFQKFEYGQPDKLIVGESWRLPGLGVVRWLGLEGVLKQRADGSALLDAAKQAIGKATTKAEVDAAVDKVVAADPGQPDIRLIAADRFRDLKDLKQERRELGLMLEVSRASLDMVQRARRRIDAIWRQLLPAPEPSVASPSTGIGSGSDAREIVLATGDGPVRLPKDVQSLPLSGLQNFWLGPDNLWRRGFSLGALEKPSRVAILVNSHGVEATIDATVGGKVRVTKTARNPLLVLDGAMAQGVSSQQMVFTVSIDPDTSGILTEHSMEVAAWSVNGDAPLPDEDWQLALRPDGSALVQRTSHAPILAAIPRTAKNLKVEGGARVSPGRTFTLGSAISEYLVPIDGKLGGNNLALFAVPSDPKAGMTVSYEWPDAAYNVPMSHYGWDRLERVYLQTPAALVDTGKKSRWTITGFPQEWKIQSATPAPLDKDKLVFEVEPQAGLTVVWNAKEVLTAWTALKHRNLTMYVPDNPNNRYWFPLWFDYVRQVYDKQVENTGYEKPNYLYIGVQGASMLSGYGGGTAEDAHTSETWLPATGRCSPYFWMHNPNPSGVDAHELHWVAFGCFVEGLPVWVTNGFGGWIEETGWRCTDLAGCEEIMRGHKKNAAAALEMIRAGGKNPMQSTQEEWDALPGPTREKMISLGWLISESLYQAYGKGFWAKFWKEQRDKNAEAYKKLGAHQKDVFFVSELVRISGDAKLKERFEKEWGFDLK